MPIEVPPILIIQDDSYRATLTTSLLSETAQARILELMQGEDCPTLQRFN